MPHRRGAPQLVIAEVGDLVVERDPDRPSGRLLLQAGTQASYTDLADPGHLAFDYLRWMRIVLLAAAARQVLHVGGAGCALARALAAADPDGRQEVYEIDPAVVALARDHLGLRRTPGLRVRVGDGAVALSAGAVALSAGAVALSAGADGSRDAVVIDAFIGARVASKPTSPAALADAAQIAPLTLVNVVEDGGGREVAVIAARLALVYPWVWAVSGRSSRNTVLVAGRGGGLDRAPVGALLARDRSPASVEVRG